MKTSTITVRLPLEVLHEIDRLSKLTKLRQLYFYNTKDDIDKLFITERKECSNIALALDSNRGNEKEIAKAILERNK